MTDELIVADDTVKREFAAELTAGEGRTVDVRIVPYGEQITHNDGLGGVPVGCRLHGGVDARCVLAPGERRQPCRRELRAPGRHRRDRRQRHRVARSRDGFHGSFRILPTPAGETILSLLRDDDGPAVLDGVSLEARPVKSVRGANGVVQRVKAHLSRRGVHAVLGVRGRTRPRGAAAAVDRVGTRRCLPTRLSDEAGRTLPPARCEVAAAIPGAPRRHGHPG